MALRSDEIGEILKARIADFEAPVVDAQEGVITSVFDGIARIYGLEKAMAGELLQFPGNVVGLALDLREDGVGAAIMGPYEHLQEGDVVRTTGRVAQVPVGDELIGRIVSAVGEPLDGKGPVETSQSLPVERVAPGVITRQRVDTPLQTGIKAIDGMIPIGRGQRELIIGDRQTGKSAIALDTIINQKGQDVICIYCAIGQRAASVAQVAATLQEYESLEHTIIVAATAAEPAALQFMAPFAACAIGEYFMQNGRNALIVYDDLSKHAAAYRQLSLLLRRPPSREAYPGDIFYLHSRLLERAARMSDDEGGGSLTALPIIETQAGDIAGYIPTNVISITDGQIFLESDLFNSGVRPAISVGTSVSRVGGDAQTKAMKQVAGQLKLDLAQYRELAAFAQFSSDLDKGTRSTLERGQRMTELLKQDQYSSLSVGKQVITFFAGTHGLVDDIEIDRITEFERSLHRYIDSNHADLEKQISSGGKMDEGTERALEDAIKDFKRGFDGKVEEAEEESDEGEEDGEERGRSEERPSGRGRERDEDDGDADEAEDDDGDDRRGGKDRGSRRATPPDPTSTSVVEKDGDRRTSEDEEDDDDGEDDDRDAAAAQSREDDDASDAKRSKSDGDDGRDGDRKGDDRDGERSSKPGAVRRRKG